MQRPLPPHLPLNLACNPDVFPTVPSDHWPAPRSPLLFPRHLAGYTDMVNVAEARQRVTRWPPAGLLRRIWQWAFGPPHVRVLEDGALRVRLLGRLFEAPDYESLFTAVSRERDHLIASVRGSHDRVMSRPYLTSSRFGPGELYHREVQRMEDRLAIYSEFLGYLDRQMQPYSPKKGDG